MKTRDEAIAMYQSNWWEGKTAREICDVQLYEDKLCMPFPEFHKAIEQALGRPVWTHEFADQNGLQAEYERNRLPENPIESLERICVKLGRKDLLDNIIVVTDI